MQMWIRILLLSILLTLISNTTYAELYYVCTDSVGKPKSHIDTIKYDIVTIMPYSPQYKPTPAELQRYFVIVVPLQPLDIPDLLAPYVDVDGETILKARKMKFKYSNIKDIKQEDIIEYETFKKHIISKSFTD